MNIKEILFTNEKIGKASLGNHLPQMLVTNWARIAMTLDAITNNKTVFQSSYGGAVEMEQVPDLINVFEELKKQFHLVELQESNAPRYNKRGLREVIGSGQAEFSAVLLSDDTVVEMSFTGKESDISVYSLNKEKVKEIISTLSPLLKKKSQRKGRACTLLRGPDGITISDLGPGGAPFNPDNYVSSVVDDYNFLVKDLASESPRGRLVILDGPPGGGKTYFVRGLINDIENSIFLIVPSSLIGHISDPSFMPAIINLHDEEQVPIIMILEDADTALLPRGMDTMSTISDLLNFADGIVGNIIDFRIVATTNAKKMEIEPALLRKGRLSRNINIGKLPIEKAKEIFERLVENKLDYDTNPKLKTFFEKEAMLADVYDLAAEYKMLASKK